MTEEQQKLVEAAPAAASIDAFRIAVAALSILTTEQRVRVVRAILVMLDIDLNAKAGSR